jgi:iron complex outermembrane receptor protein
MRFILLLLSFCTLTTYGQVMDTTEFPLQKVRVSYRIKKDFFRLTSSEAIIDRSELEQQNPYSLVASMNAVPGVRMEERSPGSYRLSVRGSLLRSPFGVRNVKIYLGDFPFTDAGGNTYLNSLDLSGISSLRILKGPEASIYGANTGGVLLINPVKTSDSNRVSFGTSGGSYGLFGQQAAFQSRTSKSLLTINQAYQESQGYRQNSAMKRHYLQVAETWSYNKKNELEVLLLFSDLYYQTPGGLTLQQFNTDRRLARQPTPTLPGAVQQKASISNRTLYGGISHRAQINKRVSHVLSLFGSGTDFKNPFITNYEQRKEQSFGLRTYLDFSEKLLFTNIRFNIGAEWQQTNSGIDNYGNRLGERDTIQASDHLKARQGFVFSRLLLDIRKRLLLELSASYNVFNYTYRNQLDAASQDLRQTFSPQLMPRIAASYRVNAFLAWRASASSGYSAPTISEVRASDNLVNTGLQAEKGLNIETGFRLRDTKEVILLDASVFYYQLSNAIVRRNNINGTEYFVNAGGTSQPGLEAQLDIRVMKSRRTGFIRSLQLKANAAYYHFTFRAYTSGNNDYSGHKLTGVPDLTSTESLLIGLPGNLSLFSQYYYVSDLPLDDAGTTKAKAYHLIQLKAQWKPVIKQLDITLFAGIDNVLNQVYSLGNDLNAAAGRYFNAAAPRNYYGGFRMGL